MRVIISLGGSLICGEEFSGEKIREYANVLKRLSQKHQLVVVVGGGKTARDYISVAKELTSNKSLWDEIGIIATWLNATLLLCALGEDAYPQILRYPREVKKALLSEKIVICGGNDPGHSTDLDAALIAEYIQADLLVNATTVDGVYDKDPKKYSNAKKFEKISYKELERILEKLEQEPGSYPLLDLAAIKIIERSRIRTVIVDGRDAEEVLRAVEGGHRGTVVTEA